MKILFITHYTRLYGANRSMCEVALELMSRGIEVWIISPGYGALTDALEKEKINYKVISYRNPAIQLDKNRLLQTVYYYLKILSNLKAVYLIGKFAKTQKIDIIHSNSMACLMGAIAAYTSKKKHVWHIREYMEEDYNCNLIHDKLLYQLYQYTDKFIVISNSIKEKYMNWIDEKNMVLVYNGISNKKQIKEEQKHDKSILLMMGVVREEKGTLDAINAVAELKRRGRNDIELWIVGDGHEECTEYNQKIFSVIEQEQLKEIVKFWGFQHSVEKFLNKADIGLMCSRHEAFGRVTVEYMLNKIPVIGLNSGGTKEILDNNKYGLLYKDEKKEDLADKIEWIKNHGDQVQNMVDKAYKRAVSFYSVGRCVDEIMEVYSSL